MIDAVIDVTVPSKMEKKPNCFDSSQFNDLPVSLFSVSFSVLKIPSCPRPSGISPVSTHTYIGETKSEWERERERETDGQRDRQTHRQAEIERAVH